MTEQEVLKKFEENFAIIINDDYCLKMIDEWNHILAIDKSLKAYEYYCKGEPFECSTEIYLELHQLLHELFKCWGWI